MTRGERRCLVALVLAWGTFLAAANVQRTFTLQGDTPADVAAVTQMVHGAARGDGLAQIVLVADRAGLADRSHFNPFLFLLAPVSAALPGAAPLLALWAFVHASAAIPLHRLARRLTGSRSLAWTATVAWCLYPYALRGLLAGLRETMIVGAGALWALDAAVAGARGRFAWTCLATLLLREDAGVLVAGLAVPLTFHAPGRGWTRARWAAAPVLMTALYLGAMGLVRPGVSQFASPAWLPFDRGARGLLIPNAPDPRADAAGWRAAAGERLGVLRALAFPAFLPALLAPEIAVVAAPVAWAAVCAYPQGALRLEDLDQDRSVYHLAMPAGFLVLATVAGARRASRLAASLATRPSLGPTRVAVGALAAVWTFSPQGPVGAPPFPHAAAASDSLECWARNPAPAVPTHPWGVARRLFGEGTAACRADSLAVRDLARRIPAGEPMVVLGGWSPLVADRAGVWFAEEVRPWRPRWQDRVRWALLPDGTEPPVSAEPWVRLDRSGPAVLWGRPILEDAATWSVLQP